MVKEAWLKVLEIKPNDSEANLYGAMYCLDSEPEKAAAKIKNIDAPNSSKKLTGSSAEITRQRLFFRQDKWDFKDLGENRLLRNPQN